jgi:hypothetical protein
MFNRAKSRIPSKGQLQDWLELVLVPVNPNPRYFNRLRGRLISYQGNGLPSPWLLLSIIAMLAFMLVASLGLALRFILGLITLITWLREKRGQGKREALPLTAQS